MGSEFAFLIEGKGRKRCIKLKHVFSYILLISFVFINANCARGLDNRLKDYWGQQSSNDFIEPFTPESFEGLSEPCDTFTQIKNPNPDEMCLGFYVDTTSGSTDSSGLLPGEPVGSLDQAIANLNIFFNDIALDNIPKTIVLIITVGEGEQISVDLSRKNFNANMNITIGNSRAQGNNNQRSNSQGPNK